MENIISWISVCIGSLLFWIIICELFNIFMKLFLGLKITIKLPKNKKWLNKVDPIYCIKRDEWCGESYNINKYVLGYYEYKSLNLMFEILLPIPFDFETYRYEQEDSVTVKEEELKDIDDIGSQYEKIVEIKTKIYLESIQRVKEKEDRLNNLNKVFIKNYE